MNRIRTALLWFGITSRLGTGPEVGSQGQHSFDFVVGDRVMLAGEYQMSEMGASGPAIAILSEDRKAHALVLTSACTSSGPSKSSKLVFHAIGGRYFLSQVWTKGYDQGRQLRTSKAEIELAKNGTTSKDLVLAANRSH